MSSISSASSASAFLSNSLGVPVRVLAHKPTVAVGAAQEIQQTQTDDDDKEPEPLDPSSPDFLARLLSLPSLHSAIAANERQIALLDAIIERQNQEGKHNSGAQTERITGRIKKSNPPHPSHRAPSPPSSHVSVTRSNLLSCAVDNSRLIEKNMKKLRKHKGELPVKAKERPISWADEEKWINMKLPLERLYGDDVGQSAPVSERADDGRAHDRDNSDTPVGPLQVNSHARVPSAPLFLHSPAKPTLASLAARVLLQPALNPPNINANTFDGDLIKLTGDSGAPSEPARTNDSLTLTAPAPAAGGHRPVDFHSLVKSAQLFLRHPNQKLRSGVRLKYLRTELESHEARWLKLRLKQRKSTVSEADRLRAREMFEMLDLDHSQSLDMEELRIAMKQLGMDVTVEELRYRLEKHDTNNDCELNFEEFLQSYQRISDWEDLYRVSAIKKYRQQQEIKHKMEAINKANLRKMLEKEKQHIKEEEEKKGEILDKQRQQAAAAEGHNSHRQYSPKRRPAGANTQTAGADPSDSSSSVRLPRVVRSSSPSKGGSPDRHSDSAAAAAAAPRLPPVFKPASLAAAASPIDDHDIEGDPNLHQNIPLVSRSDAWRRVDLPFFLWVPAWSRMHLINEIMNSGKSDREKKKTLADLLAEPLADRQPSPPADLASPTGGPAALHSPRSRATKLQLILQRTAGRHGPGRQTHAEVQDLTMKNNGGHHEPLAKGGHFIFSGANAHAHAAQTQAKGRKGKATNVSGFDLNDVSSLFAEEPQPRAPKAASKATPRAQAAAEGADAVKDGDLMPLTDPIIKFCKSGAWEAVLLLVQSLGGLVNPMSSPMGSASNASADTLRMRRKYANRRDKNGSTAAHHAAWFGHTKVIEVLIYHGLDINIQNNRKNTAAHLACEKGHKKLIAVLIAHGGDFNIKNWQNKTPVECVENVPNRTPDEEKHLKAFIAECRAAREEATAGDAGKDADKPPSASAVRPPVSVQPAPPVSVSAADHEAHIIACMNGPRRARADARSRDQAAAAAEAARQQEMPVNLFDFSDREISMAAGRTQYSTALAALAASKATSPTAASQGAAAAGGAGAAGESSELATSTDYNLRVLAAVRDELSRRSLTEIWQLTQQQIERRKKAQATEILIEPERPQTLKEKFQGRMKDREGENQG